MKSSRLYVRVNAGKLKLYRITNSHAKHWRPEPDESGAKMVCYTGAKSLVPDSKDIIELTPEDAAGKMAYMGLVLLGEEPKEPEPPPSPPAKPPFVAPEPQAPVLQEPRPLVQRQVWVPPPEERYLKPAPRPMIEKEPTEEEQREPLPDMLPKVIRDLHEDRTKKPPIILIDRPFIIVRRLRENQVTALILLIIGGSMVIAGWIVRIATITGAPQ